MDTKQLEKLVEAIEDCKTLPELDTVANLTCMIDLSEEETITLSETIKRKTEELATDLAGLGI